MKTSSLIPGLALALTLAAAGACSDEWDDHYDTHAPASTQAVEAYQGTVADYLATHADFSRLRGLLDGAGLLGLAGSDAGCTAIVTPDDALARGEADAFVSSEQWLRSCLADVPVPPSSLTPGYGIYTQNGKYLWVTGTDGGTVTLNDNYHVTHVVKAANGYVYVVDGAIPIRPNIYDYVMGLGPGYSIIQEWIRSFESTYFDASASTPAGIDAQGNTYYSDSVWAVRNELMDRYDADGLPTWNMRDETYLSTVFIPSNEMVMQAYQGAMDSIRVWLNREPTTRGTGIDPTDYTLCDSTKFVKWIVSSCFVGRRLEPAEVAPTETGLIACVGGHRMVIDEQTDSRTYEAIDPAYWKPSAQGVDWQHPVELSNGRAYLVTAYKVPNQIVLYRIKSRFNYSASHGMWEAMLDSIRNNEAWLGRNRPQYEYEGPQSDLRYQAFFREDHLKDPVPLIDGELSTGYETFYATQPQNPYYTVVWVPDSVSMADSLEVGLEHVCLMYNESDRNYGLKVARVPAGEYYLRLGFGRYLSWTVKVWLTWDDLPFPDEPLNELCLPVESTNFAMDRGGAMEGMEFYGLGSIGLPEYYDWQYWYSQGQTKATAYDTDGGNVGVVRIGYDPATDTYDGLTHTVRIKYASPDLARAYWNDQYAGFGGRTNAWASVDPLVPTRGANNGFQFKLYHWCLRPTVNNY